MSAHKANCDAQWHGMAHAPRPTEKAARRKHARYQYAHRNAPPDARRTQGRKESQQSRDMYRNNIRTRDSTQRSYQAG